LFNYNLDLGRHATYRVFRTWAATDQTDILATISGPTVRPAYLHSFFLSPDYVILCIWPCIFAAAGVKIL
jgi:torulene dioxygenase